MNPTALRPMTVLDNDWRAVRHSPTSRLAYERLAATEPVVADLGALDLGDVVDLLRARRRAAPTRGTRRVDGDGGRALDGDRGLDGDRALDGGRAGDCAASDGDAGRSDADLPAAVIRAMLRSAHVHPLVPRAIVQALAPGLVTVARRLDWGAGGEWPDGGTFLADAFTTAWEVVSEWAGEDRRYAVLDLLSAVRCRLRRRLLHHRRALDHVLPAPLDDTEVSAGASSGASTDLEELAAAIERAWGGDLDEPDAAVLYAHRVLGYSLSELSALTGRSRRYLGARRDRAAQVLTA